MPILWKKREKKLRLVAHIVKCKKTRKLVSVQTQPLDLRSPFKKEKVKSNFEQIPSSSSEDNPDTIVDYSSTASKSNEDVIEKESQCKQNEKDSKLVDCLEGEPEIDACEDDDLKKKREKFPFDKKEEEEYHSELEENDIESYTKERRKNKDTLELRLRKADCLKNQAIEGDTEVVNQFRAFMLSTTCGDSTDAVVPSTVRAYTQTVQNDILNAFHALFVPFDSRWLLDCTTVKECTFDGKERSHISLKEPIYLTARVLRKALYKYRSNNAGQQRATLVAAARQFMLFIELHFNNNLNLYGNEPLEKVISYHNIVKSYIDSTKIWKQCNKDKKKTLRNNKILKEYENPNYEAETLESLQKYYKSKERMNKIEKVLYFATEAKKNPSNKEFTELGNILMGEIEITSGVRPVVIYRLPVGAYVGKKMGFDPRQVTPDDCMIDEQEENAKIYRRLNPNLPPKHLACKHQLEHKVAKCPENCENRCDPQGFNIYCDWDKTRTTRGYSYLHLAKPIKDLLDMYDIIKKKFFKGRIPAKYNNESWLENDKTPFFLQSSGNPFQAMDMKHVSEAMRVDVTAYSFRKIISTWALSHASKDIRDAEEQALQHSLRVGHDHYKQNKELQPQKLTQTYIEEEGIIPEELRAKIQKSELQVRDKVAETDLYRQKKQHKSMLQESEANKDHLRENRPLGPRHRVLGVDRARFKELVDKIIGENIDSKCKNMKRWNWRNFIVRIVCGTNGEAGNQLRDLWVKIYKGDLKWGVRDERFRAKENNWPRKNENAYLRKKDRNSWIAFAILSSFKTIIRLKEKKVM